MLVKCSGALIDRQTAIYLIVLVLRERLVLAEFFITKKKACKQRPPFINSLILCVDLFWVYLVLIFWGFSSLVSVLDETLSIATKQGVQCNTWRIKWKKSDDQINFESSMSKQLTLLSLPYPDFWINFAKPFHSEFYAYHVQSQVNVALRRCSNSTRPGACRTVFEWKNVRELTKTANLIK